MSKPLVSVLVPVFNGEPYVSECLDSILAQDFTDYELLIGDNGSTDGTPDVLRRYAERDGRIRWWQNPKNLGMGGNFNACLREARGEFVKYMMHDDFLLGPAALGRMVAALQADPSVSLAGSATQLVDAQSRPIELRDHFRNTGVRDGRQLIAECLKRNLNLIGEPSVVLFRRRQAERGFDERYRQILDLELWFRLLEQGRFAYVAEPLCAFRQHGRQQSEVNRHVQAALDEWHVLWSAYWSRPGIRQTFTNRDIFAQIYNLRRNRSEKGVVLKSELVKSLGPYRYSCFWAKRKVTGPFIRLKNWLQRRYA